MQEMKGFLKIGALGAALLLPLPASAQTGPFDAFLQEVRDEAVAEGVSPQTAARALAGVQLDEQVIELDQKQPEKTITFAGYLRNTLPQARIDQGAELLDAHRALLNDLQARTGVPPQIVVALWGMESSFGRNVGDFDVIDSLATLAFEGRRAAFFRKELIEALHLLDEERLMPSDLRGSWAGAMGQCQFMPSTFRRYAADFDNDGRRDIWNTEADVLASVANYLASEGWQRGQSWGREAHLTRAVPDSAVGLDGDGRDLDEWNRLGVRTFAGKPLPSAPLKAWLIQPDGPGGRSFLVYDNFRALMRWNRSTYFATAVGLFADRLSSSY